MERKEEAAASVHASAGYKFTLTADSGYRATEEGRISPHRYGVVCAALRGELDHAWSLRDGAIKAASP